MADYPKREPFFAHKATRKLLKSCAAQRIGQTAALLVTYVAHTEDAKKYAGPVTFWNSQLMPILGVNRWHTFDRARQAAIDAGWLYYENPGHRQPGIYWAMIPPELSKLDDSPADESYAKSVDDRRDRSRKSSTQTVDNSVHESVHESVEPPVLLRNTPKPVPVPKEESAPAETAGCPSELKAWIDWWNRLRAESLVPCAAGCNPPSEAVLKGWSRVRKCAALRELLSDRDTIEASIRESPFCREGWFRLEKLFGSKNRDGEFIIRKLLDGGYAEKGPRNGKQTGPGQRHDPTAKQRDPRVGTF